MTTLSNGAAASEPAPDRSRQWPTMVDVARASGASLKTVSRVVNGEPGVRPVTAERVQRAIAELGFQRNDGASMLRRGSGTASIGMVLEDFSGPFYAMLAGAVERVARDRGYLMLTGAAENDPERAARLVAAFTARRVDGLIVAASRADHSDLDDCIPAGTRAVFVDRPSRRGDADSVSSDNEGGTRAAVRHLADLGHTSLGFLGADEHSWTIRRRLDGYRSAVRADPAIDPQSVERIAMGPHDDDTIAAAWSSWTSGDNPVTALVTANNRATLALVRFLRSHPEIRVGYVGFDDFEAAELIQPAVTVIAQDADEIGRRAAELLFDRIAGTAAAAQHVVIPTRLIQRDSGRR